MNPVLSVGFYLLTQVVVLALTGWCLHGNAAVPWVSSVKGMYWVVLLVFYLAAALLPVTGYLLPASALKFIILGAGNIWLGFCIYFDGILLLICIAVKLYELFFHVEKGLMHAGALAVSILSGVGLLAYGMIHAQHTVIKSYDITVEKTAGELTDMKLVLIADLHLSVNSFLSLTERMVDLVNSQEPDIVLVGGEVFTSSYASLRDPEKHAAALRKLKAKYGVYAVYGNHDVEEELFGGFPVSPVSEAFRTKEMEQFFEDSGFTVLCDETVSVADGAVQITGRVDGSRAGDGTALRKSAKEVLAGTDPEKPVIVLEHEPVEFAQLKENGADLALCGHTHDGQIFPGNLIVPFFNENGYGYKVISGLDTVVTSGIGCYGPSMRVGTNSEITVINLHFSK